MAWELKEPDEYQSSYLFKWGSKIAKLLDHVKVPYVAWGDLMNSHMIRDSDTNWGCLSWMIGLMPLYERCELLVYLRIVVTLNTATGPMALKVAGFRTRGLPIISITMWMM
ncbi:hypothetical protein AnigIFM50267_008482 [Aspergillus niger]|nr:hypothetical protein AnigIFM50267_008482 [Aspergillus niger]